MTQNEIDIIIKREVAARLPYGLLVNYDFGNSYPYPKIGHVYLWHDNDFCGIEMVDKYPDNWFAMSRWHTARWDEIKPYLRPMESMTDIERDELHKYTCVVWNNETDSHSEYERKTYSESLKFDWLNERMFDYRGLIVRHLALVAPDGMYDFSDKDESCNK